MAARNGLHEATPLWYYILKEAQQRGQGERLGPVGATLLASEVPGTFTMADLLRFVGDISPIDGVATV